MKKFVVALFVLLPLCCSVKLDWNLNNEIIIELEKLNHIGNFSSPVSMPCVKGNVAACVEVFIKKLTNLLNNVTVPKDHPLPILKGLKAKVPLMLPQQETGSKCTMKWKPSQKPIPLYIAFIKKLNKSIRRH